MEQETWKQIPNHPMYEVSDLGRIRSWNKRMSDEKRLIPYILKPGTASHGYDTVVLCTDGTQRSYCIHRLVLETFVGPPKNGQHCRHMNNDKSDNRIGNLRWGTRSENMMDRVKHGTANRGVKHGMSKLTDGDIIEIRRLYASGNYFQHQIGEMFDVSQSTISAICLYKRWQHIT